MYVYQGNYLFELANLGLYDFVAHITVTNVQIKPIKIQLNLSTYLCIFTPITTSIFHVIFRVFTLLVNFYQFM